MTSEEPTRWRFFPTKIGLGVGAILLAAIVIIIVAVLRGPPPDSLERWIYPGSRPVTNIIDSTVVCAMYSAPADFTNVVNWYRDRLRITRNASPAFMAVSGGLFSQRRREAGVINSRSATLQTETLFSRMADKMMLIHVSQAKGETNATVWLVSRPRQSPVNAPPAASIISGLFYPKGTPGPSGGTMNMSALTLTTTDSFRTVRQYFARNDPTVSGWLPMERLPDGKANHVLALPLAPRVSTNEATFVYVMAKAIALIHVTEITNQTHITIGAIKD